MSVIVAVKDRIAKAKKDAVDLLFSLHMRSITLNAVLDYDRVSQTVTGHEDFGYVDRRHFSERFEEENVASEAILFLLDCVNADMHVPVAYFMVSSEFARYEYFSIFLLEVIYCYFILCPPDLDCSQRANIVQEVINFIETNDIRMISLTIDGWPREHSIEMCAQLAANSSEDNMQSLFQSLNGNNIHVVFEASCLVTLLRNMLAYKGMIYDANNRQIRWDLITKLCKNQHLRGMQCELTNNHMRFSENMFKVTLAMETMNRRVAAGILSMSQNTKCNDRLPEVEPTAAYLTAIHDLLDLLHSKQDIALSGDYQRTFDAMNESLLYLQSCSCKENNRLKSSTVHAHGQNAALIGLQASVQSIHGIFDEYVVERKLLTSIVPDNFSNNKMDTFIACMRRKGLGQFGDCATAQQIVDSYRRLLLMKCRNNSAKNASGRRVIEINAIFDARDIPHTEAELTQQ